MPAKNRTRNDPCQMVWQKLACRYSSACHEPPYSVNTPHADPHNEQDGADSLQYVSVLLVHCMWVHTGNDKKPSVSIRAKRMLTDPLEAVQPLTGALWPFVEYTGLFSADIPLCDT